MILDNFQKKVTKLSINKNANGPISCLQTSKYCRFVDTSEEKNEFYINKLNIFF